MQSVQLSCVCKVIPVVGYFPSSQPDRVGQDLRCNGRGLGMTGGDPEARLSLPSTASSPKTPGRPRCLPRPCARLHVSNRGSATPPIRRSPRVLGRFFHPFQDN